MELALIQLSSRFLPSRNLPLFLRIFSLLFNLKMIFINFFLFFSLKIDSARSPGILLESVQLLTDMNLWIKKAYISSDGKWNMDGN